MNTITPVQQQARDELLAWLDAGAPETPSARYGDPVIGFRMDTFDDADDSGCGTVCCIAGFVARKYLHADFIGITAQNLGIPWQAADELCIPMSEIEPRPINTRDTAWAARTIRHLFETGEVDWEKMR
jgi:hypothetical protein